MNLDFLNRDKEIFSISKNSFIESFINELKVHFNGEFTLDRFEGNFAILENRNTKKMIDVDVSKIPKNAKEGDILDLTNTFYTVNYNKTKIAKEEITCLMRDLNN